MRTPWLARRIGLLFALLVANTVGGALAGEVVTFSPESTSPTAALQKTPFKAVVTEFTNRLNDLVKTDGKDKKNLLAKEIRDLVNSLYKQHKDMSAKISEIREVLP